jgi:hypothetical protein
MSGENMTAVDQLEEQAKQIDTIAKLKGKSDSKGGKISKALDAVKASTVNVYGDVVNVSRSRGGGKGGPGGTPGATPNPRVGINPQRMRGAIDGGANMYTVGVPSMPGGYGGMAVQQMANTKEGGRRRALQQKAMDRMRSLRGFVGGKSSSGELTNYSSAGTRMHQMFPTGTFSRPFNNARESVKRNFSKDGLKNLFATAYYGPQSGGSLGGGASGGLSGAMGSMSAGRSGGLRERFGRFALGQSYVPGEKMGFSKLTADILGMGQSQRGGGRFGEGYRAARANALESGQEFSRGKGFLRLL